MAWPWGSNLKSYFEIKNDHDVLASSVEMIIMTMLGERVMLCEFGSNIMELLFEPAGARVQGDLTAIVQRVVPKWDPRLEVISVNSSIPEENGSKVLVSVVYRDRYQPRSEPQTTSFIVGA
jgi:hypothetical protein